MKILYVVTEDWYFCSHRLVLAQEAKSAGYEVVVVTNVNEHSEKIQECGFKLIPFLFNRSAINPFVLFITAYRLSQVYRNEQPDVIHHVALNTIITGGIAAFFTKTKCIINALTGLGFVFSSSTSKARVLRLFITQLLKALLNRSGSIVLFQNRDDQLLIEKETKLDSSRSYLVPGSGVNTDLFKPTAKEKNSVIVILIARMLYDKGVKEYIDSARELLCQGAKARFVLVGDVDISNPSSISTKVLNAWEDEGVIEWWGRREDIAEILSKAHILCLPSYREGLPKVLLEAASCGLPIVTTDTPGCRDVVIDNYNGFLVPVRDSVLLAEKIKELIDSPKLRSEFGDRGRQRVLDLFSNEIVLSQTMALYKKCLNQ